MSISFHSSKSKRFDAYSYFMSDTSLASSGTIELLILSSSTTRTELRASLSMDRNGLLEMFEGGTQSANGTLVAALPQNRQVLPAADMTVWESPTVTDDGVSIEKVASSGGVVRTLVWVLERDQHYLFRATNTAGASAVAALSIDFTE